MNIFKKNRSRSPSFEIPKLCLPKLPRQKRSTSIDSCTVNVATSLDVPPAAENRGRSSSFDSSSLRDAEDTEVDLLKVPPPKGRGGSQRSHSFDTSAPWSPMSSDDNCSDKESSSNNLKLPKHQKRRASLEIPKICIHCVHLEAIEQERDKARKNALFYLGDTQISTPDSSPSDSEYDSDSEGEPCSSESEESLRSMCEAEIEIIETLHSSTPSPQHSNSSKNTSMTNSYTDVVTLAVPIMKQRSSSMDAGYITKPHESPRKASLDERTLHGGHKNQIRSKSLDTPAPPIHSKDQSLTWLANIQQSFK
ncbi:hypothetical protein V1264_014903 [Littorina saxatilis]|uniref:Uncharacterized protein n=1 Tax=Littorina saxatilis TaxID=31220 RepID=A0AAN9BNX1_9CAEN